MTSHPLLTIPLPLVLDDESTWPQVRDAVMRAGADRVQLYSAMLPNPGNSIRQYRDRLGSAAEQDPALLGLAPDLRFYDLWSELLAERVAMFAQVGIPVSFWMGQTLGHGGGFNGSTAGAKPPFQPAQTHLGETVPGVFCPLCPQLRTYLCAALSRISRAKPEFIILDDDFKLTNRLPLMCGCPLHQTEFRRRGLPDLPPAELAARVLTGDPGPERATWWSAHEDGIVDLGRALGEAVRAVTPTMRLGFCSTTAGWEELDLPRLLRVMAGPNRPIVRTNCAPYWLREPQGLTGQVEQVRLQRAWLNAAIPEAEQLCEGDSFPHLTTRCNATLLDSYIQANVATGAPQVLAYGFSYVSPLHFETGYATLMERNAERYRLIRTLAPPESSDLGITAPWRPGTTRNRRLDPGTSRLDANGPVPIWICSRLGIPLAHGSSTGPVLLIGTQANLATDAELAAWAARGLVLDAVSAEILRRRGIACGVTASVPAQAPNTERFLDHPSNGRYVGGPVALWSNHPTLHHRSETDKGAEILSAFRTASDGDWGPAVVRWEDARGRRFAVLSWDVCACLEEFQLIYSHPRRWQLQQLLAWVGRAPLPVCIDAPNVQVCARRTPDGRTVISLLNGSFDPLQPVLRLDAEIARNTRVWLLGPDGSNPALATVTWADDGDCRLLTLPCTLPALGTCIISLETTA